MTSLFHFFADLMEKRDVLANIEKLDDFPFEDSLLSCKRKGAFPDLAIRINKEKHNNPLLNGGELIEMKDSKSYAIASFNSTIPTGSKEIESLVARGSLGEQMEENGDDIHSLPVRQVYYLVRGRRRNVDVKICLVHGSFFETVSISRLIGESFQQALKSVNIKLPENLIPALSKQDLYSRARKVDKASVSLRFRIMTEARPEANILVNYPDIKNNTLNLVLPLHDESVNRQVVESAVASAGIADSKLRYFQIQHAFNGPFLVLSVPVTP